MEAFVGGQENVIVALKACVVELESTPRGFPEIGCCRVA
jgi:hypothetical protein